MSNDIDSRAAIAKLLLAAFVAALALAGWLMAFLWLASPWLRLWLRQR